MRYIKRISAWTWTAFLASAVQASDGSKAPLASPFDDADRSHWAFQEVAHPTPPALQSPWIKNPIDAFVLARLRDEGLSPNPPADKAALLRRAALDLTGLPPTAEDLDAFLHDQSEDAFVHAVDRLLSSPHYGERWARHWLDLARYAESEGFKADETRPNAWRYRDYVINSFNQDKPYDRFVREQIAGDELWPNEPDARIATAFNRHYPDESNARNLMQRRQEILNDITDTVGAVFVGLTYACARCHDHKYDPILQADYYRLQAFFANTAAKDEIDLTPAEEKEEYERKLAIWEEKTRSIREEMAAIEAPHQRALEKDYYEKYPAEIRAILEKPASDRNPYERQMAWKAAQYLDPASREYVGRSSVVYGRLKQAEKKRWQELKDELEKFEDIYPGDRPLATAVADIGRMAPRMFRLERGAYDHHGDEVQPGFLTMLDPGPARIVPPKDVASTGRRTALAAILTDPANPLTARVIVNRIWQHHFGRGIVATASDFGLRGERPTHPALLDWLATEFVAHGWSIKYMHRLIMTSSAYEQASNYRQEAAATDPQDKLLWRFPRYRVEAEVIRDASLAVAGLLNPKMGGPSIFPKLPAGMPTPRGGWDVSRDAGERNRRSIYVFVRRNTRYPMFDSFDMPDPHESCSRRNVTTSPIQALTLLNDELTLQWAESFAGRVLATAGAGKEQQVEAAFRLAYSRGPDDAEKAMIEEFFVRHHEILQERVRQGHRLALPPRLPEGVDRLQAAALVDLCHMLINANEFVYVN